MVGDQFLFDVFLVLPQLNTEGWSAVEKPYLYQFFNVSSFVTNPLSLIENKLARMINALMSVLNQNNKLPRLLIMIPESDLLEQLDFINSGKAIMIGMCFDYLINNIMKAIQAKKESLWQARPGAVTANEPKVLWISLINRKGDVSDDYSSVVRITNEIIEEALTKHRNNFWLSLDNVFDEQYYFSSQGQLTGVGKVKFWRAVDQIVAQFDKYEISL